MIEGSQELISAYQELCKETARVRDQHGRSQHFWTMIGIVLKMEAFVKQNQQIESEYFEYRMQTSEWADVLQTFYSIRETVLGESLVSTPVRSGKSSLQVA